MFLLRIIFFLNIFFLYFLQLSQAQNKVIDSLVRQLIINNDVLKAQTYKALCWQYRNIDRKKALEYGEKGLFLAKQNKDKRTTAEIMRFISVIHWHFLYYEDALAQTQEALALSKEIKDVVGVGFCYDNLGVIFYDQEEYQKSEIYLFKALKEFTAIEHAEGLGYVHAHLSWVYLKQKKIPKALQFAFKGLEYRKKTKDAYSISNNLRDIGMIYKERGEYSTAIKYLQEAIKIVVPINREVVVANYTNQLGDIYFRSKQIDSAKIYAEKGFYLAQKLKHGRNMMLSCKTLLEIYQLENNYQEAFKFQNLYYTYKDSVAKEETKAKIDFFDAKYHYKQRTEELLAKQKQQEIEIKRQKTLIFTYFIVFILLVFILISVLLFRMQRQERKNNRLLANKNEEIALQASKLSEVNHLKDKIFSIIAHDLRSPFRSLIGLLNLADLGALTVEDFKYFLPELSKNVNYTSGLLDNLLYWAKSQMEEASIEPEIFDIQELAENKIGLYEKQAKSKNISLENLITNKIEVFADKNMIDLVLRNLVANAVKFCRIGGKVHIAVAKNQNMWVVSVADTGEGITDENLDKLFGKKTFTTRGTNNEKGTGLGLMLCKEFVEKNGGTIWVDTMLGIGSTFYFSVPIATSM
jgi:signal transduction histidine kinase